MRFTNRGLIIALWAVSAFLLASSLLTAHAQSDTDARRQAITDLIEKAFNQGDLSLIEKSFADDFVSHPTNSTRADFIDQLRGSRAAMPDYHAQIDHLIVDGDYAAFHYADSGTFEQAMAFPGMNIPPTHQPLSSEGFILVRYNTDGKVAEEWDGFDLLPFLMQLGVIPPMGEMMATEEPGTATMATPVPMPTGEAMTTGQEAAHKAAAQAFFQAAYNSRESKLDDYLAQDYQLTDPTGTYDLAGFKASVEASIAAFPDMKLTAHAAVAEGDWVALAYTFTGTMTGNFGDPSGGMGIKGHGQKIELAGVSFFHFGADGKINGEWDKYDQYTFLQQIGLIPMMEPTEASAA